MLKYLLIILNFYLTTSFILPNLSLDLVNSKIKSPHIKARELRNKNNILIKNTIFKNNELNKNNIFNFKKQWYPVNVLEFMDKKKKIL